MMMEREPLDGLREQIDAIDDQLLELMRKRFNISRRILVEEHRMGVPAEVFSHEREQLAIDRLKRANEDSGCPMRASHIGNIWQTIFSCTRTGW